MGEATVGIERAQEGIRQQQQNTGMVSGREFRGVSNEHVMLTPSLLCS